MCKITFASICVGLLISSPITFSCKIELQSNKIKVKGSIGASSNDVTINEFTPINADKMIHKPEEELYGVAVSKAQLPIDFDTNCITSDNFYGEYQPGNSKHQHFSKATRVLLLVPDQPISDVSNGRPFTVRVPSDSTAIFHYLPAYPATVSVLGKIKRYSIIKLDSAGLDQVIEDASLKHFNFGAVNTLSIIEQGKVSNKNLFDTRTHFIFTPVPQLADFADVTSSDAVPQSSDVQLGTTNQQ